MTNTPPPLTNNKTRVLSARLRCVAEQVRADVHVDVGSDHALLPLFLLSRKRVRRVVVVEKNRAPFERSCIALASFVAAGQAQVLFGDGLAPLAGVAFDSVSLCGLGALRMSSILGAHPENLPATIVVQPNDCAEPLRRFARTHGYHVVFEQRIDGFWRYEVLVFKRRAGADPAYDGVPEDAAYRFGPLLLKQRDALLRAEITEQQRYFSALLRKQANVGVRAKLRVIEKALEYL